MRKAGAGNLYESFLKLKDKLAKEGLFDPSIKKPIPKIPRAIGIVTSSQAAALKDVLSTLARRASFIPIVIYPSAVQGVDAPASLIKALERAESQAEVDVLLIVRGGGSIEDLWAFNDEKLARYIAQCSIPIISGVGHETDFTIADFVADLRAPTPTAAAELAAPDTAELLKNLRANQLQIARITKQRFETELQRLDHYVLRLNHAIPKPDQMRQQQALLNTRLQRAMMECLRSAKQQLSFFQNRLETISPARKLQLEGGNLDKFQDRLTLAANARYQKEGAKIQYLKSQLETLSPARRLTLERDNLAKFQDRIVFATQSRYQKENAKIQYLKNQMETLSPNRTLERGYSLVLVDGKPLINPQDLNTTQMYTIEMAEGSANVEFRDVSRNTSKN
jgi:exodeoxyribonuclease VII large subunit